MDYFKKIIATFVALLLVASIVMPSVLKLTHALHEHAVSKCVDIDKLHIHESELDCDFQKFKLTTQFYFAFKSYDTFVAIVSTKINSTHYDFLSDNQKLHFALRAPPTLA
ncbi:hypothetical protein [Costertonia aggregata]|uniref:Uncharacterized protein n=1 Tax=Costertonia aggregata TaxID=343403 RepID=A0A7H9AUB8_9FLAO|nr:hypothetical protein [Costertonia aggregata]QLG47091.1 hypothetical protein HYG79_17585 [Costertonia aggregata]